MTTTKSYCVLTRKATTEETIVIERRVNSKSCCASWGGLRAYYLVRTTPGTCRATILDKSPEFWGTSTKVADLWCHEVMGA